MKKILLWLVLLLFIPTKAYSEEMNSNYDVSLSFQNNTNLESYLETEVESGKNYSLNVHIANRSDRDQVFIVSVVNAFTNNNGIIDYSYKNNTDAETVLTDIIDTPENVLVKRNSDVSVPLILKMPNAIQKGLIMGGIETKIQSETNSKGAASINQQVTMLNIIKLTTTKEKIIPELLIKETTQKNNQLIIEIQNPDAVTFGKLKFNYNLKDQKSNKSIVSGQVDNLEMAPNSSYPLTIDLPFSEDNQSANKTHLEIVGTSGKKTWNLQKDINLKSIKNENSDHNFLEPLQTDTFDQKYIILLLLIILLLVITVIYLLKINSTKKKRKRKRIV